MTEPIQRLPFVTAPEFTTEVVTDKESGLALEFPVRNDLSVTEAAWMAANTSGKQAFAFTSRLALKIAEEQKVAPATAHNFVSKVMAMALSDRFDFTAKEENWAVIYADDLERCAMSVLDSTIAVSVALVTCLIRHRIPGQSDWSLSDTRTLPNGLVQAIYAFGMKEQGRGKEITLEQATESLVEELGKSQPEPKKNKRRPTGRRSTGFSETSTQATETSGASGSEPSTAATPSTP